MFKLRDVEKVEMLFDKLISEYDKEDVDYKAADPYLKQIRKFFVDCYDYASFCVWLVDHDFDVLVDFRNADIKEECDFDTKEEFEEAKENALMISDDGTQLVMSW